MMVMVESMPSRRPAAVFLSRRAAMADHAIVTARPARAAEPLLAGCCAGERDAKERLFERYAPIVRATIAHYLGARCPGRIDLAEDLTHEVFVALFRDDGRKLREFEGRNGCSFAGWLRVVAVRLTIDALRRDRRLLSLDDDAGAMAELRLGLRSSTAGPEESLQGSESAARLRQAIDGLAPKDRLLVEIHLLRGAPLQAAATALGVSANAAYVRKSRVLDRLRAAMKRLE
jgi:RNA polymerase sigma factor (sigma-70 family)